MDLEQEAFIVYIAILFVEPMKVQPDWEVQIATLIINKAFIIILAEYLDFKDMFSKEFPMVLPKYIEINNYAIDLKRISNHLMSPSIT